MFKRLSNGFGSRGPQRDPKKPKLLLDTQLQESFDYRGGRRTFQDRGPLRRRGPKQEGYGPEILEARAAQDIDATLPVRIVIKALAERLEQFEYATKGQPLNVLGTQVDFLVATRTPYLVIDVLSAWNRPPLGSPQRMEYKQLLFSGRDYRYAILDDQLDIFPSDEVLQLALDEILGRGLFALPQVDLGAPSVIVPPRSPSLPPSTPPSPYHGPDVDDAIEEIMLMPMVKELQGKIEQLEKLTSADSFRNRQSPSYYGSISLNSGTTLIAKNGSGVVAPQGTLIILASGGTVDRSFTLSATEGDDRVCGVTLEDIPDSAYGHVAISNIYCEKVKCVSGVVKNQYLRQSTTSGQASGTAAPNPGTFAISLTDRNAVTGCCEAILMHMHVGEEAFAAGTYDSILSAGVVTNFWWDFSGLQATVASNDVFTTYVAGTGVTQAFTVDPTTGRTVFSLPSSSTPVNSVSGIRIRNTFTPRTLDDYGFKVIGQLTTATSTSGDGTSANIFGLLTAELAHAAAGAPDGIYFKRWVDDSGSGGLQQDLWQLVASTAGTATTVDLGTKPLDGELHLWEFRITGSGTSVQAYVDNVATGLPITTNLPATSTLLIPTVARWRGARNQATPALTLYGIGMMSGF